MKEAKPEEKGERKEEKDLEDRDQKRLSRVSLRHEGISPSADEGPLAEMPYERANVPIGIPRASGRS